MKIVNIKKNKNGQQEMFLSFDDEEKKIIKKLKIYI